MTRPVTMLFAGLLVLGACSTSNPELVGTTAEAEIAAGAQPPDSIAEEEPQPPDNPVDEGESPISASDPVDAGTATVTLENGEGFEFSVRCGLEPTDSGTGGRELLFTVESTFESYDDSLYSLLVKRLGPDKYGSGPMSRISIWSISENETAWGAYSPGGGEVQLTLDGNTVTGSAIFQRGGDAANPGVRGELVANC